MDVLVNYTVFKVNPVLVYCLFVLDRVSGSRGNPDDVTELRTSLFSDGGFIFKVSEDD